LQLRDESFGSNRQCRISLRQEFAKLIPGIVSGQPPELLEKPGFGYSPAEISRKTILYMT
jgi:hypothetical protein